MPVPRSRARSNPLAARLKDALATRNAGAPPGVYPRCCGRAERMGGWADGSLRRMYGLRRPCVSPVHPTAQGRSAMLNPSAAPFATITESEAPFVIPPRRQLWFRSEPFTSGLARDACRPTQRTHAAGLLGCAECTESKKESRATK